MGPSQKITFRETLTPKILTEEEAVHSIEPPCFKFIYHLDYHTKAGIMRVCLGVHVQKLCTQRLGLALRKSTERRCAWGNATRKQGGPRFQEATLDVGMLEPRKWLITT